jgi:uncharacterized protein (TIRG00374 family)
MKRKWLNEIIILVITAVVLFFVLKDNFLSTMKIIGSINIFYFLLAILIYVSVFTIEAYILFLLIREYKKNYAFKDSFKLSLMTKFFNGITPFSSGGRPLQLFELKKTGVRMLHGTNVIVQNFVIFQTSLIIYSLFTFIINFIFKMFPTEGFLYSMTVLGFIINVVILLIALLFSISKNLNRKIIDFIINSLYKIRIIKDKETNHEKWNKLCDDYYEAFKDFKYKKDLILKCIIMELVAIILFYLVVVAVFLSLHINTLHIIPLIVAANFIFLTGCYIPTPGGSGGIEYAFIHYLEVLVSNISVLSSALIIWRFATYYLPTLVGGIVFNINRKKDNI